MDSGELELREAYWKDTAAKAAFCELIGETFGIDFRAWDAAGFWDDAYRPFTLFDRSGRAVSSVCLYSMDTVVDGQRCITGQLSGVMTRPEWRRRGLALRLASHALARSSEYGHPFQYLFADEDALPLYRRLGFSAVAECTTTIELNSVARTLRGARRLDPDSRDDVALIYRMACEREPVSHLLSILNPRLVMFYALVARRDAFWYIEPCDVVVMARRREGVLGIFDVIGRKVPALGEIYPYLVDTDIRRVDIHFTPDRLGSLGEVGVPSTRALQGNNLHVRGEYPLTASVSWPITGQA